ncbi:MAG: esterase-like activity of phytase family protein [Pseudomonadota bacterium]
MRRFTAFLIALWPALALAQAPAARPKVPGATDISVSAKAVPLNSDAPGEAQLGALTYQGGLALASSYEDFGGFSGLLAARDESHLIAVSDRGHWLCFTPQTTRDGRLIGIANAWMAPVKGLKGAPLTGRKKGDAEGLTLSSNGRSILVSFEANHRIWRYPLDDPSDLCSVASSRPEPITVPSGVQMLPANGGIEALTVLPEGTLVFFSEQGRAGGGRLGWRMPEAGLADSAAVRLGYQSPRPFAPTDMARLGDTVFILHRHFSILSGVSGLISSVPVNTLGASTSAIKGEELARFSPPTTVDNLEGITALPGALGGTTLYLISDDNFNALQRTLLLKFSLPKSET